MYLAAGFVIPAKEDVSQFRLDLSLRFEMTPVLRVTNSSRAPCHFGRSRVISTEGRNLELSGVHLLYFMEPFFPLRHSLYGRNPSPSSFRRRPESSIFKHFRTSRIAGGDDLETFFDILMGEGMFECYSFHISILIRPFKRCNTNRRNSMAPETFVSHAPVLWYGGSV
jgi:hypothetical protein